MTSPTRTLAAFGRDLSFGQIPEAVIEQARKAILDTVGVSIFGADLPWSRMIIDYATHYGSGGTSTIIGTEHRVAAPLAALANGALAHGFEMDNLRQPSAGVHHGSTLMPAAFAVGEEVGASGRDVLAAFVAGSEVMSRIGLAADNTAEKLGFHSPGVTGTFGATVVAGRLLGLNSEQMVNAFGIAGSLCSGLLAFTKAGNGGMVKRLHMGRASEGGVLAARLAKSGFAGPDVILEGKYGVFQSFTREPKMDRLLHGLGSHWETLRICVKCYACHITAHTPVNLLEGLKKEHGFTSADIAEIHVATSEKVLSHHDNTEPNDIASAQYSLPFCLAIAASRDPREPRSFRDNPHEDVAIRNLAKKVHMTLNEESVAPGKAWATRMTVVLSDGRTLNAAGHDFRGAPSNPMSAAELDGKFSALSSGFGNDRSAALLEKLHRLGELDDIRTLFLS
ncbi:MmgE/PrpD family protein [Rhizobium sp. P32RR-XVIII]|uniref:MmgE/PrpD family protein n=1 Tax=Rhizobium sp. P32RR-XVIII TaxID=2726738 RepID=UPI001456E521|nr:MmgE/PrpD family protein [Rhizobium sp. P32RR-XVIII]NLS07572.1 MmgE/PrpD family protein [Rhizobium sp. P32RR-XVIII]